MLIKGTPIEEMRTFCLSDIRTDIISVNIAVEEHRNQITNLATKLTELRANLCTLLTEQQELNVVLKEKTSIE